MTADEVIALRKLWDKYNFRSFLPEATVLATSDWLAYVRTMASMLDPYQESILYPSEEECAWAWPEGVTIVLEQPFALDHTIISRDDEQRRTIEVIPHRESQMLAGLIFGIGQMLPTRVPDDVELPAEFQGMREVYGVPVLWIGTDPADIVRGVWVPGTVSTIRHEVDAVSASTLFMLAVLEALGHRLTRLGEPLYAGRGERRRVQRELPALRVLSLSSGASVRPQEAAGAVAWSRRWIVRGHWRNQPCGPSRSLRRRIWIDPFIKGPEDKPFDERRTLWRT
jgi:hypothetical protein